MVTWRRARLGGAIAALAGRANNAYRRRSRRRARPRGHVRRAPGGRRPAARQDVPHRSRRPGQPGSCSSSASPTPTPISRPTRAVLEESSAASRSRRPAGPGLPGGFAADLVDELVAATGEFGSRSDGHAPLPVRGSGYGAEFLVAATKAAVRQEMAAATERSFDDPYWPSEMLGSSLAVGDDSAADPTAVLTDGSATMPRWRALLTDSAVARYLLAERRFDSAGFAPARRPAPSWRPPVRT